jgi:hypothetical protein
MEYYRYFCIKRTQLLMLQVRGYVIPRDEIPFLVNPIEDPDDIDTALTVDPGSFIRIEGRQVVKPRLAERYDSLRRLMEEFKRVYERGFPSSMSRDYVLNVPPQLGGVPCAVTDANINCPKARVFYPPTLTGQLDRSHFNDTGLFETDATMGTDINRGFNKFIIVSLVEIPKPLAADISKFVAWNPEFYTQSEMFMSPFNHIFAEPAARAAPPPGVKGREMARLRTHGRLARFMGADTDDVVRFDRTPIMHGMIASPPYFRVIK